MKKVFTGNFTKCSSAEMNITGIVITFNEEKNIKECLESINFLDDIVIIDSNSTDDTVKMAKGFTKNIFTTEIENVTEKRKLSLQKSPTDWIMFIDADERITPELKNEIISLKKNSSSTNINGYLVNRKNYYFGKWVTHCGNYPDYSIRLFDRNKSRITERLVHEGVTVDGEVAKLEGHLLHYSVKNLEEMIKKINYYSTLQAQEFFKMNKKISKFGVFTHAISAFLRVYITRKGYKDGISGFFVSFSDCMVNFLTHLKLLKLQNKF